MGLTSSAEDQQPATVEKAGTAESPAAPPEFSELDADNDGKVGLGEFLSETNLVEQKTKKSEFYLRDRDGDGVLEPEELKATTIPEQMVPPSRFRFLDADGNGSLSEAEFAASHPKDQSARASRDFQLSDFDENEALSLTEFFSIPPLDYAKYPSIVPDPVADLAKVAIQRIRQSWPDQDRNGDERLDADEFQAAGSGEVLPGLEHSTFENWDQDGDGLITPVEAESVVSLAYGLRRVSGEPLRTTTGLVVSLEGFDYYDLDNDDRLSWGEVTARTGLKGEEGRKSFDRLDLDSSGSWSLSEFAAYRPLDTLASFRHQDSNLDGKLDQAEWWAVAPPHRFMVTGPQFAAFDADGDGLLSFLEYRLTPRANPLTPWHSERPDRNGDGTISAEEFVWNERMELAALCRTYFTRLDFNHDGRLTLDEFPSGATRWNPERILAYWDRNSDGHVELDEFSICDRNKERAQRDFHLFDFDQNGQLSEQELRRMPQLFAPEFRSPAPNPLGDLASGWVGAVNRNWATWDVDSNGSLNDDEFAQSEIAASVPGMEKSGLSNWDADSDGQVSQDEARRAIEVASGLRKETGEELRTPAGVVYLLMGFRYVDSDNSDQISLNEAEARAGIKGEAGQTRFQKFDVDGDGQWSFAEYRESTPQQPVASFRQWDIDFNGQLDRREWITGLPDYTHRIAIPIFPAFDIDGNGLLNLHEFLLTPLANQLAAWHHPLVDTDKDGVITAEEFAWNEGIELAALSRVYFDRLDLNQDHELTLDEFPSGATKSNARGLFRLRDANADGQLSLVEFLAGEGQQEKASRDFQLFDTDANEQLSLDEFLTLPHLNPLNQRGPIADPFIGLVDAELERLAAKWSQWDTDGDDVLTEAELAESEFPKSVTGLSLAVFADWDRNRDGKLTRDEARGLLEVAYGVRRETRETLRTANGIVYSLMGFTWSDQDGDSRLSWKEVEERTRFKGDDGHVVFEQSDANDDGYWSFQEFRGHHQTLPIDAFRHWDTDLDARLSRPELLNGVPKYQRSLVPCFFASVDADNDGLLTLGEYRLSPFANPLAAWHHKLEDTNADGVIDPTEFAWNDGLELKALCRFYFSRLDRNDDGELTKDEFPLGPTRTNALGFVRLNDEDGNGLLSEQEYIATAVSEVGLARRDFHLFDSSQNGLLSHAELQTVPAVFSIHERGALPDPVVKLAQAAWQHLADQWAILDRDSDGTLDSQECSGPEATKLLPVYLQVGFADWDSDGSGRVDQEEARMIVDTAFAVRHPQGELLRQGSGRVVNWAAYRYFDRDDTDNIDREEFEKYHWNQKQAESQFLATDTDSDGVMTLVEWNANDAWSLDSVSEFLRLDSTLDGLVSRDELLAGTPEHLRQVASRLLPGFDADGDQQLSMSEFRLTPLANPIFHWHDLLKDTDRDGRLSPVEFHWAPGLPGTGLLANYFARLDLNRDGALDLDEWTFQTDYRDTQRDFARLDADANGFLSGSEFAGDRQGKLLAEAERDFKVFDTDRNARLDYDEFLTIPSRTSVSQRKPVTDPVSVLIDEQLVAIQLQISQADGNSDGSLDRQEFAAARLPRLIRGFELTAWDNWDRDADGRVSAADCRLLLEIAWGLRRKTGESTRTPGGRVVNWMLFRHIDEDGDGRLARDEYLASRFSGGAEALKVADANQDAVVEFSEWASVPDRSVDGVSAFLRSDSDFDGLITPDELFKATPDWQHHVAESVFPAFDADHDGSLSLNEYLMTPLVNYLVEWHSRRHDRDNDGYLSLAEFSWNDGEELSALYRHYFDLLDHDDDQRLALTEYSFGINTVRAPIEVVRKYRDTNEDGFLSLTEITEERVSNSAGKSDSGLEVWLARTEEAFLAADADGDGLLSESELQSEAGWAVLNPQTQVQSRGIAKSGDDSGGRTSWRQWVIVAANVLLVGGVAFYLLRGGNKAAG